MNRMITPIRRIALGLAACGLLGTACEDNAHAPEDGVGTPLQVESVETEAAVTATRAATPLADGKTIMIHAVSSTTAKLYTKRESGWSSASPFNLGYTASQIYAIHMADATQSTDYAKIAADGLLPLKAEPYTPAGDTYWAPPRPMSTANPRTGFVMKPIRSRLTIRAKKGDSYKPGDCAVSQCRIDGCTTVDFDTSSGVYTLKETTWLSNTISPPISLSTGEATDLLDLWLGPITPNSGGYTNPNRTISLTIDGKYKQISLPADRYEPKAGLRTIVTVTVNGTELDLGWLSTEAWQTTTVSDTDFY